MHYSIIGSALSGNKGASAMLESSIASALALNPSATFTLFSMYPDEDRRLNEFPQLEILDGSPAKLGVVINSLALLYFLLPPLRPLLRRTSRSIRALASSDRLIDQMGISFSDGREKFLIYNVAAILPALLVGTKVVKASQAMGPFTNPINRLVSKIFLPRMTSITTRGRITHSFTDQIGLTNTVLGVDSAFALKMDPKEKAPTFASLIPGYTQGTVVGVSPSVVVRNKVEAQKPGSYLPLMQDLIAHIRSAGHSVVVIPHSVRTGQTKTQNNDLPLCREIYDSIADTTGIGLLSEELSSQKLRALIANCHILVTSRFHAMVSALAVATPPLVIGWSHKYEEVLELFELQDLAMPYKDITSAKLTVKFDELNTRAAAVKKLILKHLPAVVARADAQAEELLTVG
jgi:polysaccharide pyruvyl transferase WcaK-like protein